MLDQLIRWLAYGTMAVVLACTLVGCNGDSDPPCSATAPSSRTVSPQVPLTANTPLPAQ